MNVIVFCFVFCLLVCISGPLAALADVHKLESQVPMRCGLACVIETVVCDTKADADYWFKTNKNYKRTSPYQLRSSPDKWFVDYQVTEAQASAM